MARAGTTLQKVQLHIEHLSGAGATASPARDCWIYLFRDQKVVTFAHEIYVDGFGQYRSVALAEHHGKDHRPASRGGQQWAAVQAVKEAKGKPAELIPYWILLSPFQLPWARLCEPGEWKRGTLQLDDGATFMTWARNQRALEWKSFRAQKGSDIHVAQVSTPWHRALADAAHFKAVILEYEKRITDPNRVQERYLYGMLQGLRASERRTRELGQRPASAIEENLDLTEVWAVEQDIKDDHHIWSRCETLADSLVSVLERPPFAPVMEDWRASQAIKSTAAAHAMMAILTKLHEHLGKTKMGQDYLARWVQQNLNVILWRETRLFDFSAEEDGFTHTDFDKFKHGRKSLKSYWYFVKAYVEHVDKGRPGRMVDAVRWWSKNVYGVELRVDTSTGVPRFERESLAQLQRASSKMLSKVAFFALLDAVYLLYTAKKAVASLGKDDGYEVWKKVLSALGALTSAASAGLSVVELITMRHDDFKALASAYAENPLPDSLATPSQAAGKVSDIDLLKYQAARRNPAQALARISRTQAGKWLGAAGGAVELVLGTWNALEEIALGDTDAGAAHVVSAVGGGLATAGFIMMATGAGAVPGAVLVLVGSVVTLIASVVAAFLDDNDLEEWVKFGRFGKMNGRMGDFARSRRPKWLGDHSLGEFATRLDLQKETLEELLFKVEATVDIAHEHFTVFVDCRFAVKESRLLLSLEVTDHQGQTSVLHPFQPWHDFKYDPTSGRVRKVVSAKGVRAVKAEVQLDMFGDGKVKYPPQRVVAHGRHEVPLGWADAT